MSYHETYEFFAIDRRLTPAQMRTLRGISTRATITPTRFYNFYDWGGLKADPHDLVRRYYDLFVYTELNSGARWGILRFPTDRIDRRLWRTYVAEASGARAPDRCASMATQGKVTLLDLLPPEPDLEEFSDELEAGELDEGSLAVSLALVRADLLAGDPSALYLLWLCSVQNGEREPAELEPPRPPGLARVAKLSGVLHSFAEFMRLDDRLLAAAIESPRSTRRTAETLLDASRAKGASRRRSGGFA